MATILYAWEIGDGLGHIRNLVAVARAQTLKGHKAVFAIPPQSPAMDFLEREGFDEIRTFLAPARSSLLQYLKPWEQFRAASFVDVLAAYAYDSVDRLKPFIASISAIVADVAPAAIVTESAPSFILVGKHRAPVIATGTSYGLPQRVSGASKFLQIDSQPLTPLVSDEEVKRVIARAAAAPLALKIESLQDYFCPHAIQPLCYPLIDHYETERDLFSIGVGPSMQLNKMPAGGDGQFAYLTARHPRIRDILSALKALNRPVRAFINGGDYREMQGAQLSILPSFDLGEELMRCSRVIHHGAAGIAQAAIGAGRAQFAFPFHSENAINTAKLFPCSIINAAGYAEPQRYHAALIAPFDTERAAATALAEIIAETRASYRGAEAVAETVSKYLS